MADNKITITVLDTKNDTRAYTTDGYVLIYLDKGSFKFAGNVELSALGPMLMTIIAQKMAEKVSR